MKTMAVIVNNVWTTTTMRKAMNEEGSEKNDDKSEFSDCEVKT
jgi:hypothetical protein